MCLVVCGCMQSDYALQAHMLLKWLVWVFCFGTIGMLFLVAL
jgi:hypothetical protein